MDSVTRESAGPYRFGFHTVHFSPMFGGAVPLLDVVRRTASVGFDAIGIDLRSVAVHGRVDEVAAVIADSGLQCTDVVALIVGAGEDSRATARELGQVAAAVRAPVCIAAVVASVPWSALVENLAQCAAIMGEHGCHLAVEFTPYSALSSLHEATDLCAAIGWERCGLVIDALHFFRSGAPWAELAELSAEQIAVVQWADAPATVRRPLIEESRHGRLLPGDGGLDLSALAAAIRSTGWHGVVSAEILSSRLRANDPATVIPAAYAALTSAAAGWT